MLVQQNRDHLTRHGDFGELADRALNDTTRDLEESDELLFGIFAQRHLVGTASLVAVNPPRYGCGFWLAESATGRGIASAAVTRLVDFARRDLSASDVFAGVTHGNDRSAAVLERSGFVRTVEFQNHTRFHRDLTR